MSRADPPERVPRWPGRATRAGVIVIVAICASYLVAALAVDDQGFVYDGETVLEVDRGGAADRAGLRPGDVVIGDPLESAGLRDDRDVFAWIGRLRAMLDAGDFHLEIARDGARTPIAIPPAEPTLDVAIRQLEGELHGLPTAITYLALALLAAGRRRRDAPAHASLALGLALCGSYYALRGALGYASWMGLLWAVAPAASILGLALVARAIWTFVPVAPRRARGDPDHHGGRGRGRGGRAARHVRGDPEGPVRQPAAVDRPRRDVRVHPRCARHGMAGCRRARGPAGGSYHPGDRGHRDRGPGARGRDAVRVRRSRRGPRAVDAPAAVRDRPDRGVRGGGARGRHRARGAPADGDAVRDGARRRLDAVPRADVARRSLVLHRERD